MDPDQLLSNSSSVSLHEQVRRDLLSRITNGEFAAGDMLPSEEALCNQYGVSRITIRRAVTDLAAEFFVTRKRGVGTVVTRRQDDRRIFRLTGFFGEGLQLDVRRIAEDTVPATPEIAAALNVESGALLNFVRSVAHRDGEPFTLTEVYIPSGPDPRTSSGSAAQGQRIERAEQELDAINTHALAAEHLGLKIGQPIMRARRVFYTAEGKPVRYTESCYHPSRYRFMADLRPRMDQATVHAHG